MKNSRLQFVPRAVDLIQRLRLERWTVLAVTLAFIVGLAAILLATEFRSLGLPSPDTWTPGRVAERDYVVERDFLFVNERATDSRREAQERLVPPVFALAPASGSAARDELDRFSQDILRQVRPGVSEGQIFAALQDQWKDRISRADLRTILSTRSLSRTMQHARDLLDAALSWGIVDMIAHEDEASAAGEIELRRMQDGRLQSVEIPVKDVVTRDNVGLQTGVRLLPAGTTDAERAALRVLLEAFAVENAFYDADASQQRRDRARAGGRAGHGKTFAGAADRPPRRRCLGGCRGQDPRARRLCTNRRRERGSRREPVSPRGLHSRAVPSLFEERAGHAPARSRAPPSCPRSGARDHRFPGRALRVPPRLDARFHRPAHGGHGHAGRDSHFHARRRFLFACRVACPPSADGNGGAGYFSSPS